MKKLLMLPIIFSIFISCGQSNTIKNKKIKSKRLVLAHSHTKGFPVDSAYRQFAKLVNEKSNGRYIIDIYPSAQLGNSIQTIELTQIGVVQFAHINSAALEGFDPIYSIFNLPYIFKDHKHFRTVMDSSYVQDIFESTITKGFVPLIYLEGGARSLYTADKPILTPKDIKGMKIRVQESPTSIEMIQLLGGTPIVLSFGEVYGALQQGLIDGAENNSPSFVQTGHAEIAKHFSLNEHLRLADFLTVSSTFWNKLSDIDKKMFHEAADETIDFFDNIWIQAKKESFDQAENTYNVTIHKVNQEPFRKLVFPMHETFAKEDPKYKELLTHIRSLER